MYEERSIDGTKIHATQDSIGVDYAKPQKQNSLSITLHTRNSHRLPYTLHIKLRSKNTTDLQQKTLKKHHPITTTILQENKGDGNMWAAETLPAKQEECLADRAYEMIASKLWIKS